MFSSTPVERLSRQIILESNPTRLSQIQLPKNPDPPDTRILFPSNALGSIVLLIASRSSLIIGSFNLDARPHEVSSRLRTLESVHKTNSGLPGKDLANQCPAMLPSDQPGSCKRRSSSLQSSGCRR